MCLLSRGLLPRVVAAEESEILAHKVRCFSYWNASTASFCSKLCNEELLTEQRYPCEGGHTHHHEFTPVLLSVSYLSGGLVFKS